MHFNFLDNIKNTIALLFILGTVISLNTYADEEIWFHANSSYTLKKFSLIPELHFRNRFSDSEKTKAFKLNALADKLIAGAAYFDFPKELNERRLYTVFFYKLRELNSRNLVEFRHFNEGDLYFRYRSKIEYEFNPNELFIAEILFQQGLIK